MVYAYRDKTLSCSFRDSVTFACKKIKKLYPLHLVMLFLSILIFLATKSVTTEIEGTSLTTTGIILLYLRFLIVDVLLIQSWIPSGLYYFSLNGVAWYLSTMLFLYAVFPLILKGIKRFFTVKRAIVLVLLVYIAQCVLGFLTGNLSLFYTRFSSQWFTYIFPIFRLGDFVIGCCFGYLFLHRKSVPGKLTATFSEIASFAVITIAVFVYIRQPYFIGSDFFRYTMLNTPGSVLLIWSFANGSGALSKLLTNRPLLFIGKISSYGFLIHQPVIHLCRYLLVDVWSLPVNKWLLAIFIMALTAALSVLYMQIEAFVRKRRNRAKTFVQ